MMLIDIVTKFRNTYAPIVAEDPRLLDIYVKQLKEFQADMQDECMRNEILTDVMVMDYMMKECDFLEKVARIKMSSMY